MFMSAIISRHHQRSVSIAICEIDITPCLDAEGDDVSATVPSRKGYWCASTATCAIDITACLVEEGDDVSVSPQSCTQIS